MSDKKDNRPIVETMTEQWDMVEVDRLAKSLPNTHHDYAEIQHIKRTCSQNGGQLLVGYKHAKQMSFGRIYADHGYQKCTKDTRAVCASKFYEDDDIKNAYPTILAQTFDKFGMPCPHLTKYVADRENIIAGILKIYGEWFDFKEIKKYFLMTLFLGDYTYHSDNIEIPFLDSLLEEMKVNCRLLIQRPEYQPIIKELTERRKDKDFCKSNYEASCVSFICQVIEKKIIDARTEYLTQHNFRVDSNQYDGMLRTKGQVDEKESTAFVQEKTGYIVQFEQKPMQRKPLPASPFPTVMTNKDSKLVLFETQGCLYFSSWKKDKMEFTLRPGAAIQISRLKAAGFAVGIYTNRTLRRTPVKQLQEALKITFDVVRTRDECYLPSENFLNRNYIKKGKQYAKHYVKQLSNTGVSLSRVWMLQSNENTLAGEKEIKRFVKVCNWEPGRQEDNELDNAVTRVLTQNEATQPEEKEEVADEIDEKYILKLVSTYNATRPQSARESNHPGAKQAPHTHNTRRGQGADCGVESQ